MWTGSVSPFIRQKARNGIRPARNKARRAARRQVLPGYPVEPRALSRTEIESYFKGDRPTCLRCGKSYRKLGVHLRAIHAMTPDDYRGLYGLPWTAGLCGAESSKIYSDIAKMRVAEGTFGQGNPEPGWQSKYTHRKPQPYRREVCMANLGQDEYPPGTFDKVLDLMREGLLPYEITARDDMPSPTWLQVQRNDQALNQRFLAVLDAMPFDYQRRSTLGMGPRFWEEVKRLRTERKSDHTIAAELGVTAMTINNGRRKRNIP